jgi:hypothetical protein
MKEEFLEVERGIVAQHVSRQGTLLKKSGSHLLMIQLVSIALLEIETFPSLRMYSRRKRKKHQYRNLQNQPLGANALLLLPPVHLLVLPEKRKEFQQGLQGEASELAHEESPQVRPGSSTLAAQQ